ncbi:hypothetical protein ABT282_07130 [Streptomyces sp. NPDC000927]|uniref:hypothetical protein n=1 Tax=Streptomyces sp. NPDC000927 TaxID=3154371 RepID=UPI00332C1447
MSLKKLWKGAMLAPLVHPVHKYSETGVLTECSYMVAVVTEVRDEGHKEHRREIVHRMTSDMARRRAQELIEAADEADRKNAAL